MWYYTMTGKQRQVNAEWIIFKKISVFGNNYQNPGKQLLHFRYHFSGGQMI